MIENKELREEVKAIVAETEKTHRYSMSRIYKAHNAVFARKDTPQACASCLIRKVNELKKWLADIDMPTKVVNEPKKKAAKSRKKNV